MITHKTVAVVIEKKGKILLIKRPQGQSDPGKWTVPGGHVEGNETVQLAAKREMKEEVGGVEELEQVGTPFVHEVDSPRTGHHQHICSVFHATKSDEPVVDKEEADDWAWFTPEEMKRLDLAEWTKKALSLVSIKLQ